MAEAINESMLRTWMERLGPRLITLSAGICRDRHQAEEIVQEAFVKLWRSPPDAGEIAFTSWLRRVVTNLSINALQRTRRPRAIPEYSTDRALRSDRRPDEPMDTQERLRDLRAAMDRLDPPKRTILMLRASEQMSYEEIATHLGVPVGTVMSRLNRARAALMEELRGQQQEDDDAPMVFRLQDRRQA